MIPIKSTTILGPTKNGSNERKITVPEGVINLLRQWRETAPLVSKTQFGESDRVFGNSKSPSWAYARFRSSVNRTLKNSDSGVDSLRLHRLRHTVATMLSNEPDSNVFPPLAVEEFVFKPAKESFADRIVWGTSFF